jgi:hypothetical protein
MNTRVFCPTCVMAALALFVIACQKPQPVVAVFFHQELCPGCGDYQRAEVVTNRLLALARPDRRLTVEAWQVISGPAIARLKEIETAYGLSDLGISLPCLVVDGRVVVGYPLIDEEISRLETVGGGSWWGRPRPR